jgi:hypothetical protein
MTRAGFTKSCRGCSAGAARASPGSTYRFFENSLKPRIVAQRQDVSVGLFGLHKLTSRAADVPYCGASFTYTNYTEWHGSAELGAGRTYTGYSSIEVK